MKKLSFVSIIYNTPLDQLIKSLESFVSAHKETDEFEVLLVNNASTDKSLFNFIKETYSQYHFIKFFELETNNGKNSGVNFALKHLRSEYFMFVDPDDWIDSTKIKSVIDLMHKEKADTYIFNYTYFNQSTLRYSKRFVNTKPGSIKRYNGNLPINLWHFEGNLIKKTSFVSDIEINSNIKFYTDVYLNLINIAKSKDIVVSNINFYFYRVGQKNTNLSGTDKVASNRGEFLEIAFDLFKQYKTFKFNKRHLMRAINNNLIAYIFFETSLNKEKKTVYGDYKSINNKLKEIDLETYKEIKWYALWRLANLWGLNFFNKLAYKIVKKIRR